jgi:hypothetical protein
MNYLDEYMLDNEPFLNEEVDSVSASVDIDDSSSEERRICMTPSLNIGEKK